MSQRFSLDRTTFERFLAAASLVQQVQNQALRRTCNSTETVALLGLVETQQAIQTGALDLEAACFQVTSLALKLTGGQGAGVWLFTQDAFAYRAGAGSASNSERLRLAVLSGLALNEPTADTPELSESIRCSKAKSLLVAPIYQGPKVSGALAVFSEAEKAFTEREAANTRLLAGILAHAVDKTAEAELMHSVALERAAMQKVVERLIPSLMRLTGLEHSAAAPVQGVTGNEPPAPAAAIGHSFSPALSPILSASREIAGDLPSHQPEDILRAVGPLRRSERNFVEEAELAETNPHWVQSLNPGFQRWVPVGPAEHVAAHSKTHSVSTAVSAGVTRAVHKDEQRVSRLPQPSVPESTSDPLPAVIPASVPEPADLWKSEWVNPLTAFFHAVKSAGELLRWIRHLRLNVRFEFHYKPTLRAMSLGLAAALLSIAGFLALQSGESPLLTSLAANSSSAHPNGAETNAIGTLAAAASKGPEMVGRVAPPHPAVPTAPQSPAAREETSHRRITDPHASGVLGSISRYEISSLQRRAEYGDDAAAFVLGMAYEVGHGVPRSCGEAARWVALAAQQGNAAAEYNLALRYRTADSVKANPDEAEKWFRKAARHRYPPASAALVVDRSDQSRAAGQP